MDNAALISGLEKIAGADLNDAEIAAVAEAIVAADSEVTGFGRTEKPWIIIESMIGAELTQPAQRGWIDVLSFGADR